MEGKILVSGIAETRDFLYSRSHTCRSLAGRGTLVRCKEGVAVGCVFIAVKDG